tara:strand:- start:43 stop:228 length:186 start_codon:yes stop_codon:yes gene_type:complete
MLHKISDFCDKIDTIKAQSDKLRQAKYGSTRLSKLEIDAMIDVIQADCLLVASDKSEYNKE